MLIIDSNHHDLEIVYGKRYIEWQTCRIEDLVAASGKLAVALDNLKAAGYTVNQIKRIERHALSLKRKAGGDEMP